MPEDNSVGLLIKRARQRKRMTQEQLAVLLKVSRPTVTNWENGTHYPLRYAGAIEEALGITLPAQPEDEVA